MTLSLALPISLALLAGCFRKLYHTFLMSVYVSYYIMVMNIMVMNKTFILQLFIKWTVLVWLNAILSLYLAVNTYKHLADRAGILCAVFTFVLIYTVVDFNLWKNRKNELRKTLILSVLVKAILQPVFFLEMITGIIATKVVSRLMTNIPFVYTYFITMVDGLFLSLIVLGLTITVHIMRKAIKYRITEVEAEKAKLGM